MENAVYGSFITFSSIRLPIRNIVKRKRMQHKSIFLNILRVLLAITMNPVIAQPALHLHLTSQGGEVGKQAIVSLNITDATDVGGFNAHIILPADVDLISVKKGSLLTQGFTLDYHLNNQDLKVVAYSATESVNQVGELLNITLQIKANASPSLHNLVFSEINSNSLINSKHAVASSDGLFSLGHTTENSPFLVYNETSDHDNDGISDVIEIANGSDPLVIDRDITPDNFNFIEQTDVALNTLVVSNRISISASPYTQV